MRIRTERLELVAPDREVWRALLEGDFGPAIEGYPTQGDIVMAGLVVEGHIPAGEWGPWQVTECETGHIVGGVGFKGAPSDDGVVEIGYGLAPSARGRGLAVEAVRALVVHAFDRGASGVLAECDLDNVASRRVLERAGFTLIEEAADVTWWRFAHAMGNFGAG
jgi:RimJ/RimL family protein N-acetyltransferase